MAKRLVLYMQVLLLLRRISDSTLSRAYSLQRTAHYVGLRQYKVVQTARNFVQTQLCFGQDI